MIISSAYTGDAGTEFVHQCHYFTKEDVDENVDKIQVSLETMGISFRLNSVQHEEETGYIHFEWIWEVS